MEISQASRFDALKNAFEIIKAQRDKALMSNVIEKVQIQNLTHENERLSAELRANESRLKELVEAMRQREAWAQSECQIAGELRMRVHCLERALIDSHFSAAASDGKLV